MSTLTLIWIVALSLAGGAVLWMSGLIVMRMVHTRRAARRLADRRALEAALIGVLQGQADVDVAFAPYRGRARLLAETLLDFVGLVRGEDRAAVIAAMTHIGADRTLRARVGRGSLAGRLASIEALGAFPGPETQFTLIRAASAGPAEVRIAALRSLFQAGGEVSIGRLLAELAKGDLPASGTFADLLRLVVEADPAAARAELATPALPGSTRVLLLEALGAAGDYAAISDFTAHAGSPEPDVRTAAVQALGRLMHPLAEPTLRAALADPEWQVRSAAAEAAGAGRLPGLAESLAERLDDPVWRVRHQAAEALGKLGANGLARLEAVAKGPEGVASRAASLALAAAA